MKRDRTSVQSNGDGQVDERLQRRLSAGVPQPAAMAAAEKPRWTSKSHGHLCAAIGCTNSRKNRRDLSFFKFPKDPERCRVWVQNTRRKDLIGTDLLHLHKCYVICAEHFEASQFMNMKRNQLIRSAVPTLFKIPNCPRPVTGKRPPPKKRADPRPSKKCSRKKRVTKPPYNMVVSHVKFPTAT